MEEVIIKTQSEIKTLPYGWYSIKTNPKLFKKHPDRPSVTLVLKKLLPLFQKAFWCVKETTARGIQHSHISHYSDYCDAVFCINLARL